MHVAENSLEFAAKCLVRRSFGTELAPHNPGLQLFPVFRGGPAVVLLPFSFFRAVPITFVASAQSLFLLGDPASTQRAQALHTMHATAVLHTACSGRGWSPSIRCDCCGIDRGKSETFRW